MKYFDLSPIGWRTHRHGVEVVSVVTTVGTV